MQGVTKTNIFTTNLKTGSESKGDIMNTGTILIVDDNKGVLASLELLLENYFCKILTASNPNQITALLTTHRIDVVILDMNFSAGINNGNEGLYWLGHIRKMAPTLPVVMLTAYGDVELAVKALKNGAADFLLKPWDNQTLIDKVTEAYRNNMKPSERQTKENKKEGFEMLVGHSPAMLQLMKVVSKVARTDANILITGENGTGKEILAREIHRLSPRGARPMLNVDMGAISESLFESELFGHERGAFTDAYESRRGKFEAADGSSLFMDEIGNLPLSLQAKLLTVLQSRNVMRLGSNKVIPVDIRLISATNKDIPAMVKEGMFREDLFYRLSVFQVHLPALRERAGDIKILAAAFAKRFSEKLSYAICEMTPAFLHALEQQPWKGNIRELRNVIERSLIVCEGGRLDVCDLPLEIQNSHYECSDDTTGSFELAAMERRHIARVLEYTKGNKTETARLLKIGLTTLYRKIEEYKI